MEDSQPKPEATDLHVITAEMLCERADVSRRTLHDHVKRGLCKPGAERLGKHFWTVSQSNQYLCKTGKQDKDGVQNANLFQHSRTPPPIIS